MHPPRISRAVPKGKRRPDPRRAVNHLAFIRILPCIACGCSAPSAAAHIRKETDGYMGGKPADRYTLPLCTSRYVNGRILEGCHERQHRVGEVTFYARLRIDPLDAASALWTHSGDLEAGERIVSRARQAIELKK